MKAGDSLDVETTLCNQVRLTRLAVAIQHVSSDPLYKTHPTPRRYGFESYVSVPIILNDGECFGTLCALDLRPANLLEPQFASMFELFAKLIALQLESDRRQEQTHAALVGERAVGGLREEFIAVLGHDLRNPLSAVSACAELVRVKSTDPLLLNVSSRIAANVRRMTRLIEDATDFARGRLGGGMQLDLQLVEDLDASLGSVVAELRDAHPARHIECGIYITRPVRCDRGRLQQVASNLLANAVVHGPSTGAIVFRAHTPGDELVMEVWNDGDPIPPDSLGRIFEPFSRATRELKREGLGLGLFICAQIVRAHQGRLEVFSTRDAGTQFTAHVPLA